jgi:hypothetical protein
VNSSANGSARSREARNAGGAANSSLSARNTGGFDGGWHSFGTSRGASGFARGGFGRGGGFGCCWGRGFGWGFGFGWPYWGSSWAFGWGPWYNPYWYGPWPAYGYYPYYADSSYDWSDDPPYRQDSSNGSPTGDLNRPGSNDSSNYDSSNYDDNFNLTPGASSGKSGSVQNGETPQPEAAPDSSAPAAQPQPSLVSQRQT